MELQIKPYSENENYLIYSDGRIFNNKRGKFLNPSKNSSGYFRVNINNKDLLVHRIVAQTFISNPNNYPCVNHKDENKTNNDISNLEWCTYQYNNTYNNKIKRGKIVLFNKKPIIAYLDNGFLKEFNNWEEIKIFINTPKPYKGINLVLNGYREKAYGYKWKYKGE